jgi:hypothetical protein
MHEPANIPFDRTCHDFAMKPGVCQQRSIRSRLAIISVAPSVLYAQGIGMVGGVRKHTRVDSEPIPHHLTMGLVEALLRTTQHYSH